MKKRYLLIAILFFLGTNVFSQTTRFYKSMGFAYLSDFGRTPVFTEFTSNNNADYITYSRSFYFSSISHNLHLRYNLVEFNENMALGINTVFSYGAAVAFQQDKTFFYENLADGIIKLNLPVYLSFDFGAGSTSISDKSSGFVFGFGAEANKVPLISFNFLLGEDPNVDSFWIQPIALFSYRYWNQSNLLCELGLTLGLGEALDYPVGNTEQRYLIGSEYELLKSRAYSVKLTYKIFF